MLQILSKTFNTSSKKWWATEQAILATLTPGKRFIIPLVQSHLMLSAIQDPNGQLMSHLFLGGSCHAH